jgi:hypothetical protein
VAIGNSDSESKITLTAMVKMPMATRIYSAIPENALWTRKRCAIKNNANNNVSRQQSEVKTACMKVQSLKGAGTAQRHATDGTSL